jgi:hypothetical protein
VFVSFCCTLRGDTVFSIVCLFYSSLTPLPLSIPHDDDENKKAQLPKYLCVLVQSCHPVRSRRTAFYCSLVAGQFWHAFVCKTRVASMFQHGLFNNSVMNYGCVD